MVGRGVATFSTLTLGTSSSSADAAGMSSAALASDSETFTVGVASGNTWRDTEWWCSSPSGTLDNVTYGLGPLRSLRNAGDACGDGVGWASKSSSPSCTGGVACCWGVLEVSWCCG